MRYVYIPLLAAVLTLSLGAVNVNAQSDAAVDATANVTLQARITELLAQVSALKAQLAAQEERTTVLGQELSKLRLESRLTTGSQGEEVRTLQKLLASDSTLYPEGLVTGVFGPLTENAVKRFQAKLKLEQVGIVGPQTLAKINEILAAAGVTGSIPSDFLGSRIKIEVETKDGKQELKIEVKCDSSGTGNLCEDDNEEDEDEDKNELEIEVEIEAGRAHVDVEQNGDEFRFVLNTIDHSAIIAELSNRLNLTKSDIESVIEFDGENDAEEDEEDEDDEDDEDDDDEDEDEDE